MSGGHSIRIQKVRSWQLASGKCDNFFRTGSITNSLFNLFSSLMSSEAAAADARAV
jgi:hypothetical protein